MSHICRKCGTLLSKARKGTDQFCATCDPTRVCNYCNKKFIPQKNNPSQEYCNDICWKKAYNLN